MRTGFLSVLALCLAAAGCSREAPEQQRAAPVVTVTTVTPQAIPFSASFVAQTESSRQVDIVARVSGFLDRIAYAEGELVKEGQLLFQLDPKPFQVQLDAAKGELLAQEARHTTAAANLKRVKPLAAQNAMSQADLDKAQGEFDASDAAVYSARAKLKQAELNLGYTTIRSPVTGFSGRALQRQGAYINAVGDSAKLSYVAAVEPMWVNFSMSQNQLAQIRDLVQKGQLVPPKNQDFQVELVLSDGKPYAHVGRINFADPTFSQDTGSFQVRAVLPNPKRELRPGMFVTANVKGGTRPNAVVVPQLAVQQGSKGHVVYVVKEDGTAELRPVLVGDYSGEKGILIASGLQAGDRVVVDGALRVVPGQPVKVAEPGAAGAGKAESPAKAAKSEDAAKK
ncbi:MAG TPA: efflux RND transporter periplasmic adaptor subunit [Burkholderiales bacterium]|nr:efflux RND transporter periplasmic adaptor subunit [Burkholderiales bacterium]